MMYSNSPLVSYTKYSPNHSGQRTHTIDRITPHCVVGQSSVEFLGDYFANKEREASSNYGIGVDGRIALYVEEKNRSWCSSSEENDQRAITIECASAVVHPYKMNSKVYASLIELCTDICKRYGKKRLLWIPDKKMNLSYEPKPDEMVITVHRWFANKSCPGDWLYERLGDLANKVTNRLMGIPDKEEKKKEQRELYRVRKTWTESKSQKGAYRILKNAIKCADRNPGYSVFDESGKNVYRAKTVEVNVPFRVRVGIPNLNIRTGPGMNHPCVGVFTGEGIFTIVEVKEGEGSNSSWGKLKSGAGWISLDFATRI